MSKKKTTKEFILDARRVHGDRYDYSLVNYKNNINKVDIICKTHGVFSQLPINHINKKQGCPICSGNKKSNTDDFIQKAREIHGDEYDYSLVNYKNAFHKIKIICKNHGVFEQTPNNHLKGKKCPDCSVNKKKTTEIFIEISNKKHNNYYDYSLVDYIGTTQKVDIICPVHGVFSQKAYNHMSGIGCPFCNESKGEKLIVKYLTDKNVDFTRQKKFVDCKNKRLLPFDFHLPKYNICIEFDGIQHYQKVQRFGGYDNFIYTKKNDNIKNKYCKYNNIKLFRIKYLDIKKINKILDVII